MTGNVLTVELPEGLAAQLAAMPDAERNNFTVAALSYVMEDQAVLASMTEDPEAVSEIAEALQRLEAAEARCETGLSLDDAWAELDRRAANRRS